MPKNTPFFPGASRVLFGRPPVSELAKLARERGRLGSACASELAVLFGRFLPASLLVLRAASGANSRVRIFSPAVTFWAFLGQVLEPGAPFRKAVANVQRLFLGGGAGMPSCDTGAYCRARRRLPVRFLRRILDHVAGALCASRSGEGGRTLVVDGTAVTMPDTAANRRKYPKHGTHRPGCGFPIMKIVGLFCLDTGAWIACAKSHNKIHESQLFRRLFRHLRPGDTVVADRGFCSYFALAELEAMGVGFVMRNHQKRKVDYRTGRRLGRRDHVTVWEKSPRPRWMKPGEYAAMPDQIVVRETRLEAARNGFRTRVIDSVSSFICPGEKTSADLCNYYLRRWRVELYLDDIKTSMAMDVLRTRDPAMVCRELLTHMIAYNLARSLMLRSGADPPRASFKETVDRVAVWAPAAWAAPSEKLAAAAVAALLQTIAEDKVPERPGRREPRVLKRRLKPYQLTNKPRDKMVEIQHRNNYRKAA